MDIAEKIKKLLALASSNNPHEAALAAARAQELMVKYAIEEAQLRGAPGHVEEPIETQRLGLNMGKIPHWMPRLAQAIGTGFFCQCYYVPGRDIVIVGRRSDREAFIATFSFIKDEVLRLCNREWNTLPADFAEHGKRWKTGFCEGCVTTIRERLIDAQKQLVADNAGTAIVLADRNKAVQDFIEANVKLRKGQANHSLSYSGYNNGKRAGHAINLDKRAGASKALKG